MDRQSVRKAAETLKMNVVMADKLYPQVLIQIEKTMTSKWAAKDQRRLDAEFAATSGRNWTVWPRDFLRANLMHGDYVDAVNSDLLNKAMDK